MAAKCYSTISRRTSAINPILVKLAEIAFLEYDYKKSEEMTDSVLQRTGDRFNQDQSHEFFAYLLKSYYTSMRGEDEESQVLLSRARAIKPNATFTDVDVIRQYSESIARVISEKDVIVKQNQEADSPFEYLRLKTQSNVVQIIPTKETNCFMEYFDDFLLQICTQAESMPVEVLQKTMLDCSHVYNALQIFFQKLSSDEQFRVTALNEIKKYDQRMARAQNSDTNNEHQAQAIEKSNQPKESKRGQNNAQAQEKRSLRRKVDTTEQQIKLYKLEPWLDFKNFSLKESQMDDEAMNYIFSSTEIVRAKNYLSQNVNESHPTQATVNQDIKMQAQNDSGKDEASFEMYFKFVEVLEKCQNRGIIYIMRQIPRLFLENNEISSVFLNFMNSSYLYRMLLVAHQNDLTKQTLESLGSFESILSFFEMSLFNSHLISHVKSNALIYQRDGFFEYLDYKEQEIFILMERERDQVSPQDQLKNEKLKIRFYHAMMFFSFEIKNDMHLSIKYFQKINMDILRQIVKIDLPWISESFVIDESKLISYGQCKIKEAQIVKQYDETLIYLKQLELQDIEDSKKSNVIRPSRIKQNYTQLTGFYLDQFCQYLQKSYQSESQVNANYQTNEEKIKEMWNKLTHCLVRCETPTMLKISSHLFSILTAFQYLQKPVYDQLVLKKLEFEPIISEICERIKHIFTHLVNYMRQNDFRSLVDIAPFVSELLFKSTGIQDQMSQISFMMKIETHLIRLLSGEFLHYQITPNHSRFGEQLLQSLFLSTFYIETITSIIRAKKEEDLNVQLRTVSFFIKKIDKLTYKNQEVFIKAYFKFLCSIYSPIMMMFVNHVSQDESKQLKSNLYLNDQNDLLQLLTNLSSYFFGIRLNVKEISKSAVKLANQIKDLSLSAKKSKHINDISDPQCVDEEDDDDEESEDEKKSYRLKMLYHMRENQTKNKIWALISGNSLTKQQVSNSTLHSQQLGYLQNSGIIDATFLSDIFSFCNIISQDRIIQCGKVIKKDVLSIATFLDTVGKFLLDTQKIIKDLIPDELQHYSHFKNSLDSNPTLFQIKQQSDKSQMNPKLRKSLSSLTFQFLNIISHFTLESSPYQVICIQSGKRKLNLLESLTSLNCSLLGAPGCLKFIKNLRAISRLDLSLSEFSVESLIIYAQITAEMFNLANASKLNIDYKQMENYTQFSLQYKLSIHTNLTALNRLYSQSKQLIPKQSNFWHNMALSEKFKLSLTQIITTMSLKMQSIKFVAKRADISDGKSFKKLKKVQDLKTQIKILAFICEKIEKLQIIREDPRMNIAGPNNATDNTIVSMIEGLIQHLHLSQSSIGDKFKFFISADNAKSLEQQIQNVTLSYKNRFDTIQLKTSFEYPLIQAISDKSIFKDLNIADSCRRIVKNHNYLRQVSVAAQVALTNKSVNGCIESFMHLLSGGLALGITLKYAEEKLSSQELRELKFTYETVVDILLKDKKLFKFVHNTLIPLSQAFQASSSRIDYDDEVAILDDERENSILLDEKISASMVRRDVFKNNELPSFNEYESGLHQMYLAGDRLYQILSSTMRPWQKMRIQQSLVRAMQYEVEMNTIKRDMPNSEVLDKIREMIHAVIISINILEDNGLTPLTVNHYCQEDLSKNFLSQLNHSDFALCSLRMKLKEHFVNLVQKCQRYDQIKDLFKKYLHLFKQVDYARTKDQTGQVQVATTGSGGNSIKSIELYNMFNLTKYKYIETIAGRIEQQLELYLDMRNQLFNGKGKSADELKKLEKTYSQFRDKLAATRDSIPPLLKDMFELFAETHQRKSFLLSRRLIDDRQKRLIRQAVLKCSAICGPDQDMHNDIVTSKFLDLRRILDEEYECDGLLICLKWFMNILEERQTGAATSTTGKDPLNQEKQRAAAGSKNDQDLYKRLKLIFEEIDKQVKEQLHRNKLVEQDRQQLLTNFGIVSVPGQVTSVAQKVFQDAVMQ